MDPRILDCNAGTDRATGVSVSRKSSSGLVMTLSMRNRWHCISKARSPTSDTTILRTHRRPAKGFCSSQSGLKTKYRRPVSLTWLVLANGDELTKTKLTVATQSDASDFSKEELTDFAFKLHGHKHTFQAGSKAERDSWLAAVEATAAEAKTSRESIVGSDGYKNHMSKLSKNTVVYMILLPN